MAQKGPTRASGQASGTRTIEVAVKESDQFRIIHVDGAWGGVALDGGIAVSLYNEQRALPSHVTLQFDTSRPDDVAREVAKVGTDDTLRRIEVEARMTSDVARKIGNWLIQRADESERAVKELRASSPSSQPKPKLTGS